MVVIYGLYHNYIYGKFMDNFKIDIGKRMLKRMMVWYLEEFEAFQVERAEG